MSGESIRALELSDLGETIQQLRQSKQLTQDDLGRTLGVSPQAVSKWEKGLSAPDITLLPSIARLFGVTIDALLNGQLPKLIDGHGDAEESISMPTDEASATTVEPMLTSEISICPDLIPARNHAENHATNQAVKQIATDAINRVDTGFPHAEGTDDRFCTVCHASWDEDEHQCPGCHSTWDEGEQHCLECHTTFDEGEHHCCECHATYEEGEVHCPVCHVTYDEGERHCCECQSTYDEGEIHCLVCHTTYDEDEQHCCECHATYGEGEIHCPECHETYDESEQHCPVCHETYDEDECHCPICHETYDADDKHTCSPRRSER